MDAALSDSYKKGDIVRAKPHKEWKEKYGIEAPLIFIEGTVQEVGGAHPLKLMQEDRPVVWAATTRWLGTNPLGKGREPFELAGDANNLFGCKVGQMAEIVHADEIAEGLLAGQSYADYIGLYEEERVGQEG